MKKFICTALVLSMTLAFCPVASAAHVSYDEALSTLTALDLFRGTDKGPEPDRAPNRYEALAMLLRLLGLESAAKTADPSDAFSDAMGSWCTTLVAYARVNGITKGVSADRFGGENTASVRDYLTFVLRSLGYEEGVDFTWQGVIAFSDSIGLTHGEYRADSEFLRRDMILISYTALTLPVKGSGEKLIERLYSKGVVRYADLVKTRLSGSVNFSKPIYTSEEIYERASSAVFKLELYTDEESCSRGRYDARASGFFVTDDGVAVTCYHSIDGMRMAYALTSDGSRYAVTDVLYYDALQDVAVIRVSRTSDTGAVTLHFPYLDLGDSDAISVGEAVYSIGAPLGLEGTFASGNVSSKNRIVDDPLYPCIQFTSPISSGSSGGVLLNSRCEVVGIVYAMFTAGNALNLAVPVNALEGVAFLGYGQSLDAVCTTMEGLKKAATITSSEAEVTLRVGETRKILISSDCPGTLAARYLLSEDSTISCEWGEFTTKRSVELFITGDSAGETVITISFHDGTGNEEFTLEIPVTVIE